MLTYIPHRHLKLSFPESNTNSLQSYFSQHVFLPYLEALFVSLFVPLITSNLLDKPFVSNMEIYPGSVHYLLPGVKINTYNDQITFQGSLYLLPGILHLAQTWFSTTAFYLPFAVNSSDRSQLFLLKCYTMLVTSLESSDMSLYRTDLKTKVPRMCFQPLPPCWSRLLIYLTSSPTNPWLTPCQPHWHFNWFLSWNLSPELLGLFFHLLQICAQMSLHK